MAFNYGSNSKMNSPRVQGNGLEEQMWTAAEMGNVNIISHLVKQGIDINA
jgi:hypothetical protein